MQANNLRLNDGGPFQKSFQTSVKDETNNAFQDNALKEESDDKNEIMKFVDKTNKSNISSKLTLKQTDLNKKLEDASIDN